MPFTSQWYVPEAVIYSRFSGQVSEEDVIRHGVALNELMRTSSRAAVHVLVDSSDVTKPLSFVATIKAARATPQDERIGWVVTVGEQDPMLKFISDATRQLLQLRSRNFRTRDEALDFLKSIDDTIDWSQAQGDVLSSNT
ncbi:MAG: hypothetical protein IT320_04945 [Anaerolineae bacterium]|nr:hypothetical protein [Anaerolineae bacterium]